MKQITSFATLGAAIFASIGARAIAAISVTCVLLFVLAHVCSAQDKGNRSKPFVEGYVELDGKPIKNAQLTFGSATSHAVNSDIVIPIITPKVVGVIGETGTPEVQVPDWVATKKTDKSGHFRVDIPRTPMKIFVMISAQPEYGFARVKSLDETKNIPCIVAIIQAGVQNVRYNLASEHTPARGGCLPLGFDTK
jgi:hypothetical protein